MRIIGSIDHPVLKISVFKADNRISVKFENALYEQTFEIGEDERFTNLPAVQKLVDPEMIEDVLTGFSQMHATRMAVLKRQFPVSEEETFEEII